MMYEPRLLKQMLICLQVFNLMLLMNLPFPANFCLLYNWLMLNKSIKEIKAWKN